MKQGVSNCSPPEIPATDNENFVEAIDNDELVEATSYRSLIGPLLFFAE